MQGARRRPWWLPRASRATPQTPLSLPTLRDRADFPSCGVVASLLGTYPTASAPPCLRGNLPRSRPREILRQAPRVAWGGRPAQRVVRRVAPTAALPAIRRAAARPVWWLPCQPPWPTPWPPLSPRLSLLFSAPSSAAPWAREPRCRHARGRPETRPSSRRRP